MAALSFELSWPLSKTATNQSSSPGWGCLSLNNLPVTVACCTYSPVPLVGFSAEASGVARSLWASTGWGCPFLIVKSLWASVLTSDSCWAAVSRFPPPLPHIGIFQHLGTKSQGLFFCCSPLCPSSQKLPCIFVSEVCEIRFIGLMNESDLCTFSWNRTCL